MIRSLLILKVDFKLLDFELWLYAKIRTNLRSQKIYLRFREELFCLLCARKCLQSVCASSWLRGSLSTSPRREARPLPPQGTQPIFLGSHSSTQPTFLATRTPPPIRLSVCQSRRQQKKVVVFLHTISNFGTPISTSITSKTTSFLSQSPQKLSLF